MEFEGVHRYPDHRWCRARYSRRVRILLPQERYLPPWTVRQSKWSYCCLLNLHRGCRLHHIEHLPGMFFNIAQKVLSADNFVFRLFTRVNKSARFTIIDPSSRVCTLPSSSSHLLPHPSALVSIPRSSVRSRFLSLALSSLSQLAVQASRSCSLEHPMLCLTCFALWSVSHSVLLKVFSSLWASLLLIQAWSA